MRLMRLVPSAKILLGLLTVISACGADRYLNVITLEPRGTYSVRGVGAITHTNWPIQQLEVKLKDVSPRTAIMSTPLEIELEIRNKSDREVLIPASKDYEAVLAPGVSGRRAMHFALSLNAATGFDDFPTAYATASSTTVGATSLPGSMVLLAPGDSLTIKAKVDLFVSSPQILERWRVKATTGLATVEAQAQLKESIIDDTLMATVSPAVIGVSKPVELVLDLRSEQ